MFSALPTNVKAAGETTISIIPATNKFDAWTTPVNSTFVVNATVTNVTLLWNWQINVTFDPSILNCTSGGVAVGSPFDFEIDSPVLIDNTAGYVQFGSSRLDGPGVNGSGVLATINFKIIKAPTTPGGTLSCDINFSRPYNADTYLNDPDMVLIPATLVDATFLYTWSSVNTLNHLLVLGTTENYTVVTVSNCSLSPVPMKFNLTEKTLYFNVSGAAGEVGYVNVTIPKVFAGNTTSPGFNVTVGTTLVTPQISFNTTHTFIYFTVNFTSTISIAITAENIVPEFPSSLIMLTTFLIATLAAAAIVVSKKKTLLKRLKK